MAIRKSVIAQREQGLDYQQIALSNNINRHTVRSICQAYEADKEHGLKPHYEQCGKERPDGSNFVFRAVRCLKTWHPSWGAEKIWAQMRQLRPELPLPHPRTFQRWFVWNEQSKLRSRLPGEKAPWARRVHKVWQIDAKEDLLTLDGVKNCWLNIKDEYSGAVFSPPVFPLGQD